MWRLLPLAEMKFAFAGKEALAEQDLRPLQCTALDEFVRAHDKEIAYVLRVVDEESFLRTHAEE